jgi:hypothetical protein
LPLEIIRNIPSIEETISKKNSGKFWDFLSQSAQTKEARYAERFNMFFSKIKRLVD